MGKAVLIITVLAVIILGSIYFLRKSPSTSYPTQNTQSQTATTPTGSLPSGSPSATQNTVTLTQSGFQPTSLSIKAGDTVTWINKSGVPATVNSNPHPTHTDYPPLNLGQFSDGSSLTLTFPTAGTYGYHNHLNPSETGTIIVR